MQDKFSNIKERVLQIPELKGITKQAFFKKIGMSYGNFTGKSKSTPLNSNAISNIYSIYPDINLYWLLTGTGTMLNETPASKNATQHLDSLSTNKKRGYLTMHEPATEYGIAQGVPLLDLETAAGFGNSSFSIEKTDIKARYIVPAFQHKKVDFLIEIDGTTMYPKYNSGDFVACNILKERSFLQWNKVHVIATKEQGIIVKRIHQGEKGALKMVSENNNYPPFEIPEDQITGIALIVGAIRLE